MTLTIAWIGKSKNPAIQSLTEDYLKRLRNYTAVEALVFKDEDALLKLCGLDGRGTKRRLVVLERLGKPLSSEELADFIGRHRERDSQPLVFAVGPADGFSDRLRRQADFCLSLGNMTIAHELARVVVLEQLYRAFTILKGHPYHLGH
ncbi:MAG: 23S rRNA (pseudouridine(1915)-N(3))-methyltransferase RlmH [Acidobacteria bacterium]|nr:23S rRNA (pseudouridine(1915)-N(3))-methyltransferase RlmH [Acidobacteriota bacterium]MBV9625729.1 23S rRNA (pseudouridine(1915)-N(3))-methyltransferase RlmH [Acidobacteriota bacterium]